MADSGTDRLEIVDRRWPRTLIGLVLGAAVGAGAAFALLAMDRTGTEGGSTAHPGDFQAGDAATELDDLSHHLLNFHLPEEIEVACSSTAPDEDIELFALLSVSCDLPPSTSSVNELWYSSFHDARAMRAHFSAQLKAHHISPDQGASPCRTGQPGAGPWYMDRPTTLDGSGEHHLGRPHKPEATYGRLLCWKEASGQMVFEWYDGDTHIYAHAEAPPELEGRLFEYWRDELGPFHPPHAHVDDGDGDETSHPSTSDSDAHGS